ncbi:hypothetical protein X275_08085 [Marinitoga sp. 1197]|uniref:DUF368 domain-containing protein n=1 Tax=Marinitoga sp. 1197 TaxID=1428449 RepID=UPI0006597858|nr:DUF368 domain-containing protein [Marinitoga sp. 1197]KLO21816.1 hypothetical protein X275_08085 [Marinitoga sp. 1197]
MRDFILGLIMGIAELLPGISGGTIAAISGRYEIVLKSASDIISLRWSKESLKVILSLIIGMGTSIIFLSKFLSYLFNKYPEYSYGIFAGLIIGGLIYLSNQINFKKRENYTIIIITFIIAYFFLSFTKSIELTTGKISFWYLMFGGIIAVSVMVLPGVSGSSMLLIMGLYKPVINAVSNFDFDILIPVALGIFLGLIFIIKLLDKLMKKFHEKVMSFLIGLTLAGLFVIFPITSKILTYIFFIIGIFLSKYLEKILNE